MLFLSLKKGFDRLLIGKNTLVLPIVHPGREKLIYMENIRILKIRGLILDSISQCFHKNRGVFEPENT